MDKKKRIASGFRTINSKLLPLISLVSIIGTVIVLVSSTLKAAWYSDYFGIPLSNFDYISTVKDMVMCIGPCITLLITVYFYILLIVDDITGMIWNEDDLYILFIVGCMGLTALATCLMVYFDQCEFKDTIKYLFYISWIIIYCSCSALVISEVKSVKRKIKQVRNHKGDLCAIEKIKNKHKKEVGYFRLIILLFAAFIVMLYLGSNIYYRYHPDKLHKLEIAHSSDETYAILCDFNNSKVAMTCSISEDQKSINIDYGKYKFINPEDYSFEYVCFDHVICNK